MAKLILVTPGLPSQEFPLGRAMLLIGRDNTSDLQLTDGEVSKDHASIVFRDNQYFVRDNGSTNGTTVNGKKVREQVIAHGDEICFGPYAFRVDLNSDDESVGEIPSEKEANIQRHGHDYRSSVTIDPAIGSEKSGSIQIVMADRKKPAPKPQLTPAPKKIKIEGVPVPLVAVIIFLALGGFWVVYDSLQTDLKNKTTKFARETKDLAEETALAKSNAAKFETDYLSLKKEFAHYRESTENIKIKQLNDTIKKVEAELEAYRKLHPPISALVGTAVMETPPEVTTLKEIEAPAESGGHYIGNVKLASGSKLKVLAIDGKNLWLEYASQAVRVPKNDTDYAAKLALLSAANDVEKSNTPTKDLTTQAQNESKEGAVAIIIPRIGRIESTKDISGNSNLGVATWITDVDTTNLVSGEAWRGDVFPIGVMIHPEYPTLRYRAFTTNREKFIAYQNSDQKEETYFANNTSVTSAKIVSVEDLLPIYNDIKISETIEQLNKVIKRPTSSARTKENELKRFAANISPDYLKASDAAKALIPMAKNKLHLTWLQEVIVANELLKKDRYEPFLKKLEELEVLILQIKVQNQTSNPEAEKKPKE